MGKPLLYSFWASSCAWRVRIALNSKGIDYDMKTVDLLKSAAVHLEPEFVEINPMRQVPALYIDGHTLIESLNIMEYLEETRSEKPLMPRDPQKRARVREHCGVIVAGIQPLQNLTTLNKIDEIKRIEWAHYFINRGFNALERLLSKSSGKYCVGDELSLADCCLVPQVFNARSRFQVDVEKFPTILRIDKTLTELPAFQKSHPFFQPDCPPEYKK